MLEEKEGMGGIKIGFRSEVCPKINKGDNFPENRIPQGMISPTLSPLIAKLLVASLSMRTFSSSTIFRS